MAANVLPASLFDCHPTYDDPAELGDVLIEYLFMCIHGRIEVVDGVEVYTHDSNTVPTMTGAAWYCGFSSRQSLYDYEKKGGDWKKLIDHLREAMEHWLVTRATRPKKGDNPIFMNLLLQAKYDYVPANRLQLTGDGKEPLTIEHKSTPDDVTRVIESLGLEKKVDKKDQ